MMMSTTKIVEDLVLETYLSGDFKNVTLEKNRILQPIIAVAGIPMRRTTFVSLLMSCLVRGKKDPKKGEAGRCISDQLKETWSSVSIPDSIRSRKEDPYIIAQEQMIEFISRRFSDDITFEKVTELMREVDQAYEESLEETILVDRLI